MNEVADLDVSFRVLLDQDGKLYWMAEDEGTPLRYDTDPMTTLWQRFLAGVIRMRVEISRVEHQIAHCRGGLDGGGGGGGLDGALGIQTH